MGQEMEGLWGRMWGEYRLTWRTFGLGCGAGGVGMWGRSWGRCGAGCGELYGICVELDGIFLGQLHGIFLWAALWYFLKGELYGRSREKSVVLLYGGGLWCLYRATLWYLGGGTLWYLGGGALWYRHIGSPRVLMGSLWGFGGFYGSLWFLGGFCGSLWVLLTPISPPPSCGRTRRARRG